jgi:hypothetical protein
MDPLQKIETGIKPLVRVGAIFSVIAAVGIGVMFVMDKFWKPTIQILTVDYAKGLATLRVNGKERVLYQGSILFAGWNWGVQFSGDGTESPERLELVKDGMTYRILDIQQPPAELKAVA